MALYLGIDATNWLHTIYHANSGHAVLETVVRRIEALTRHLQPKLVIACLDRRSFRHDLYPPYKAKRGERPHDGALHDILTNALGVLRDCAVVVQADGFEADDCLATIGHKAATTGNEAVLASPDKDLHQSIVDDRVLIVKRFHLLCSVAANVEVYATRELHEQWGLKPEQWIDYQTVVGDSGDGVPGCKGWGKDTWLPILKQYGNVDNVYDHIDDLKVGPARKKSLIEFRNDGLPIMRTLVTLRTVVEDVQRLFVSRRRIGANHA